MPTGTPRFGVIARREQARFRTSLSAVAQPPDDDEGRRNPHLLAYGHELEKLFPGIRGADSALAFFAQCGIEWWTNARSGDREPDATYVGPTRNLTSSQVSCMNFLLPLASVPGALLSALQAIDADVTDVEMIVDSKGHSAPVEFEWVGRLTAVVARLLFEPTGAGAAHLLLLVGLVLLAASAVHAQSQVFWALDLGLLGLSHRFARRSA